MQSLGQLRQAGSVYKFEVDENNIFVNGQVATFTVNRRGSPVVTFGETTIENIGVMKFRLEKTGFVPRDADTTKPATKPASPAEYDNVFETWDMSPSEKREFERRI